MPPSGGSTGVGSFGAPLSHLAIGAGLSLAGLGGLSSGLLLKALSEQLSKRTQGEATEQGSPRTSLCPIQASHKADPDSAGGQVAPPRDGEAADVAQGHGAEMGGAQPPRSAAWASSVCETNTVKYTHSWSCLTEALFLQNFFFKVLLIYCRGEGTSRGEQQR